MCSAGTALLLLWVISCVGWETAAAAAASSSWGAGAGVPQQGLPLQQQTHHGHVALVQQQQPWWSHTSKQQAALRHTAAKAGAADASLLFQQQQQQQQHQQQKHHHRHRRQLLQLLTEPEAVTSSPVYSEWLEKSQQYSKRYAQGSCFADYPGFIAKDITGVCYGVVCVSGCACLDCSCGGLTLVLGWVVERIRGARVPRTAPLSTTFPVVCCVLLLLLLPPQTLCA